MKLLLLLILHSAFCILHLAAQTNRTPLNRAFLQSDANGNRKSWTNLSMLTATGNVFAVSFVGSGSNLTDIGSGGGGGIATIQTNGGTIYIGGTLLNFVTGSGITLAGGVSGSQVSLGISTSFNTNGLASTNYVVSVGTNAVRLAPGANISIATNFSAGTVTYTISGAALGNTTNNTTLVNNLPVIGQGGNGLATTNISAFRGLIAAMSATNLLNRFNVFEYGATNNKSIPSSLNQTNIQRAIDAAGAAGGGIVYFPAGVYNVSTNFTYPTYYSEASQPSSLVIRDNNVFLLGDGPQSIIRIDDASAHDTAQFNLLGSNYTTNMGVINLTLDGNFPSTQVFALDLTQFYSNSAVLFENVRFINGGMDGVDVQWGGPVTILNCTASNIVYNAINVQNDLTFIDNFRSDLCGSNDVPVIDAYSSYTTIQNCFLVNCDMMIRSSAGAEVVVNNCYMHTVNIAQNITNVFLDGPSRFSGVTFVSGAQTNKLSWFVRLGENRSAIFNDCKFTGRQGIYAQNPESLLVVNSEFNLGNGIYVSGATNNVQIFNNKFNNGESGPALFPLINFGGSLNSHNASIKNNLFLNGSGLLVTNASTNMMIEGNSFINSYAEIRSTNSNVLRGHKIRNNSFVGAGGGLYLENYGNTIENNTINRLTLYNAISTNTYLNNEILATAGSATALADSYWINFTNGTYFIGATGGSNVALQAQNLRVTKGTTDFGSQAIIPSINNPSVDFAYRLLSISTNANFNAVTANASSNRLTTVIYTNTAATWITGLLSTAFTWLDNAGQPASSFRLPPTNIATIRYSTDVNTNYFAEYLSTIPNLPLESIGVLELLLIPGQTVRWDPTLGFTNVAWPAGGSVSSVSTDTNMSVVNPTTAASITFTNYSGIGPFVRSNGAALYNVSFVGAIAGNGSGLTNLNFDAPTNAWTINTPFTLGITNGFLSQAAATVGITGVNNLPTVTERFGQLTILATGTVVFTNAPGIKASDYLTSRTITNGNACTISLMVIPGRTTNMALVQFQ